MDVKSKSLILLALAAYFVSRWWKRLAAVSVIVADALLVWIAMTAP
jgi:hypothetical protein